MHRLDESTMKQTTGGYTLVIVALLSMYMFKRINIQKFFK